MTPDSECHGDNLSEEFLERKLDQSKGCEKRLDFRYSKGESLFHLLVKGLLTCGWEYFFTC